MIELCEHQFALYCDLRKFVLRLNTYGCRTGGVHCPRCGSDWASEHVEGCDLWSVYERVLEGGLFEGEPELLQLAAEPAA